VCSATGFLADQTRLKLDEKRQHLGTPQLLAQARLAMRTDTMYLKYCLCQIDTACTQLHFGRSFLAVTTCTSTLALQCRFRKDASIPLKPYIINQLLSANYY
jgi:hypothetical protein